jgi:hypothetical protein
LKHGDTDEEVQLINNSIALSQFGDFHGDNEDDK